MSNRNVRVRDVVGRGGAILAIFWLAWHLFLPPWIGRSWQQQSIDGRTTQHHTGMFGLSGGSGSSHQSPWWSPPQAAGPGIAAAVRYPWQAPSRRDHIEINVSLWLWNLTKLLIPLGLIVRLLSAIDAPIADRRCALILWGWSWSILAFWIVALLVELITGFEGTSTAWNAMLLLLPLLLAGTAAWAMWRDARFTTTFLRGDLTSAETPIIPPRSQAAALHRWWRAVALVTGLVGGGLGGLLLAIGLYALGETLGLAGRSGGPGGPGMGLGIAVVIVALLGTLSGAVCGVLAGIWYSGRGGR